MYDMKPMAQSLASQGRYGDTMLVHMNPVEVAGLDAYTRRMGGGGLTVNPRTGQPEAFLPMLLGLGLQGLGMGALHAGLLTGIGTAAATGDIGKGLMAGLGAYGGADIGSGLSAAGATTSTVAPTAGADIVASASQATPVAGLPGAAPASGNLLQAANMPPFSPMATPSVTGPASMAPNIGPQLGASTASPLSSAVSQGSAMAQQASLTAPTGGFAEMGRGFQALGTEPGRAAFMKSVGGGSGLATDIGFGALSSDALTGSRGAGGMSPSLIRPYEFDPSTRRFTARSPYKAPGPEYKRYQAGGLASQIRTGYRDGNMVRGQGDGMSDEIEATIEGDQDVLLSDGEYVIPADVVAMLGNGSSDAGEKAITDMIRRLRMKKYGRDKQPPEMDDEDMLPA